MGEGFVVRDDDRLFAEGAAGQDECGKCSIFIRRIAEEEIVQRCVGQHDADGVVAGCDACGEWCARQPRKHHDGAAEMQKCGFIVWRHVTEFLHRCDVAHHQCEWFGRAVLASPEFDHCFIIGCIASKEEAAETFYSEDLSSTPVSYTHLR